MSEVKINEIPEAPEGARSQRTLRNIGKFLYATGIAGTVYFLGGPMMDEFLHPNSPAPIEFKEDLLPGLLSVSALTAGSLLILNNSKS